MSSLFRLMCFQHRFVLVLNAFRKFWYKYTRFDPNYRMVVVASIQMLLARWILDIAYFRHYHYYGHVLSIIGICNPEETSCYARPASVILNCNTGLKCWPCRGRTPSCHYQDFFAEYADSMTFAWILDVSQLKKWVKQQFSPWILLPVITKYVRPYFQLLVDKGLI